MIKLKIEGGEEILKRAQILSVEFFKLLQKDQKELPQGVIKGFLEFSQLSYSGSDLYEVSPECAASMAALDIVLTAAKG